MLLRLGRGLACPHLPAQKGFDEIGKKRAARVTPRLLLMLQKSGGRYKALVLLGTERIGAPKLRGEQGGNVLPI